MTDSDMIERRPGPPNTEPAGGPWAVIRRYPLVSFFTLAFGVSWLFWLPYILGDNGIGLLDFTVPGGQLLGVLPGAYVGPLGAAFIVTAICGGRAGLRSWRSRVFQLRVGRRWYLFAIVGVPALALAGAVAIPGAFDDVRFPATAVLAMYLPYLILQVMTSGLAEEPGWRDFALPLMQRRSGPARGTLFLGIYWAIWHLPLFFTDWSLSGGEIGDTTWFTTLGTFLVMCVALSFVITWVFNHTKGSLPLAMLLHASVNTAGGLLLPAIFVELAPAAMILSGAIGFSALAVILLVVTKGRLGYRPQEYDAELIDVTR